MILKILKIYEGKYLILHLEKSCMLNWHIVYNEFHPIVSHIEAMLNLEVLNGKPITDENFNKDLEFKTYDEAVEFLERYEALCMIHKLNLKK